MQMSVLDAVVALRMAASKTEARRLIEQGGVKLNDQPVQSATAAISGADLDERGTARLTVGKKRHGLIKRG
jgi:tyrosyl-tRNA synthetase